jgi:chemotaxis protein methyltransferase CheR
MIYFDDEERKRVIDKFHRSLTPGGYLFLGHAESLQGVDARFEFVFADKGTAYKKPEGVER